MLFFCPCETVWDHGAHFSHVTGNLSSYHPRVGLRFHILNKWGLQQTNCWQRPPIFVSGILAWAFFWSWGVHKSAIYDLSINLWEESGATSLANHRKRCGRNSPERMDDRRTKAPSGDLVENWTRSLAPQCPCFLARNACRD
jgi:hypothetical protein